MTRMDKRGSQFYRTMRGFFLLLASPPHEGGEGDSDGAEEPMVSTIGGERQLCVFRAYKVAVFWMG